MCAKIKFVLFDFDGVLIDSEAIYFSIWEELLKSYNIHFSIENLTGKTDQQFLGQFHIQDKLQIIIEKQKIEKMLIPMLQINIRFIKLIQKLEKQEFHMAVVSNNHSEIILECLSNNKILGYFENNIFSPNLFKELSPKPSGDLYLKAISKFNFPINQILAIEDSQTGFEACKNANLNYIQFNHHLFSDSVTNLEKILL